VNSTQKRCKLFFSIELYCHATAAAALASRGKSIPNRGTTARNAASIRLGEAIGSAVMGQEKWAQYITTSIKIMLPQDKPFIFSVAQQMAKSRSTGERDGWVFHHADVTVPRWSMTDKITYRLPDHTEENPSEREETLRDAISQAYHRNWERHLRMVKDDRKDKDAGKQLSRRG